MKFNTRDWSRSIQRRFPLHWNTLDHGTLELDLFGLSCTQIVRSSRVQPSHLMHARMHMHSAANGWCNAGTGPAGRIDRIKKCLADAEARRGRESRAMNGRGEEGDRGARHGSRRRDSPGPLKSETAQSSCPPRPLASKLPPPSPSSSASACAPTLGARLSLTPRIALKNHPYLSLGRTVHPCKAP